jgi:hypothetical protein
MAAVTLSSVGNGASFRAFRQQTRVRLLPALRFGIQNFVSAAFR